MTAPEADGPTHRRDRPAQRRQVDAHQSPAARGAARHPRRAGHHTRRDSRSVRDATGKRYTLVDTAGIRRRARVTDTIEKFSVAKALQAVEEADAVIVLLDAREGVTEQDVSLIGLVLERGRALTLGINKWDGLTDRQRRRVTAALSRDLPFLDFVEVHPVSALHGSNILELFQSAARPRRRPRAELPTQELNAAAGGDRRHASAAGGAPHTASG